MVGRQAFEKNRRHVVAAVMRRLEKVEMQLATGREKLDQFKPCQDLVAARVAGQQHALAAQFGHHDDAGEIWFRLSTNAASMASDDFFFPAFCSANHLSCACCSASIPVSSVRPQ